MLQIYDALQIERHRIDVGQPWQNYIETQFNILRRMADAGFAYCEQTVTELRYPGPPPRYCPSCRQQLEQWRRQDDRDAAAERMRRLRE